MISMAGPFIVETVGENPFLCGYRTWLPSNPDQVWEFPNARELGNFFEACCASVSPKVTP